MNGEKVVDRQATVIKKYGSPEKDRYVTDTLDAIHSIETGRKRTRG